MGKGSAKPIWKKILDLCDELSALKERLDQGEDAPSVRRKLRAALRETVVEIQKKVSRELRSGILSSAAAQSLPEHAGGAVLALLLARYVSSRRPEMPGREILDLLFQSSFAKLQGIALLRPDGALRTGGLVEAEATGKGSDPLDARFRLSEKVVRLFCEAGIAQPPGPLPRRRVYRNHREYLLDLKALRALYQQRAARLFDPERFPLGAGARAETGGIERRIRQMRRRILETLEATPACQQFAAVRFQREYGLSDDEMLIVVGLLFQELLEGEAFADAVELVKMVSADEEDLIRKRRLLRAGSPLLSHQIVQLEDMIAEKEMTAEVVLSNWVVERLLGDEKGPRAIAPDEKIDFHNYLKSLDSAETFLEDLKGEE